MPIVLTNTNDQIRGFIRPNNNQRVDFMTVIYRLDFSDLSRGARTLYTSNQVRLDLQGTTTNGGVNLQVQIGNSTCSAVIVAGTVLTITDPMNQRGAVNKVISALNRSLDDTTTWKVSGTLP